MPFVSPLAFLESFSPDAPSLYTQRDFEAALRAVGFEAQKQGAIGIPQPIAHQTRRVLGMTVRNLRRGHGSNLLCLMMGPAEYRLIPDGIFNRCALYCWDTWPDNFSRWDSLFTRFRTEIAFFTSRQARDRFQIRFPATHCHWLPDGSNLVLHRSDRPLADRSIGVLEIGRRYDRYHNSITAEMCNAGIKHLYEPQPGRVVFPGREAMLEGLAESKIVICFPTSVTNPVRNAIETITPRYFEAMASGCLVLGHCPADLCELFGYNPVIEADKNCSVEQIKTILTRIEEYQPLIRRNLAALKENTWAHRARTVKSILESTNHNGLTNHNTGVSNASSRPQNHS